MNQEQQRQSCQLQNPTAGGLFLLFYCVNRDTVCAGAATTAAAAACHCSKLFHRNIN